MISVALSLVNAGAATILNGSFETTVPAVGNAACDIFTSGSTSITGWTVVGPPGTALGVFPQYFVQSGISVLAENGSNWLDLTGLNSNNAEGVQQAVATTIGDSYTLSFWV